MDNWYGALSETYLQMYIRQSLLLWSSMKSLSAEKLNICFIFEKYKNFPIAKPMKEFHILVAIELFINLFMNLIFALEPFLFLKRFSTSHFHLVLSFLNLKSSQYNFPALCKENFKMHLSCEQTFITSVALVVTFLDFSMNRLMSKKKNISDSPSSSSPCFSLCLLPLMFPRVILPVVWAQTLANLTFLRWSPNWGG